MGGEFDYFIYFCILFFFEFSSSKKTKNVNSLIIKSIWMKTFQEFSPTKILYYRTVVFVSLEIITQGT